VEAVSRSAMVDRSVAASSIRKRSLTPQAALISPVGSLLGVKMELSRSNARAESRSPARSSSRRFAHPGSFVPPRRPSCSRTTRWRTSVTNSPASRSRWKWSAMTRACGRACSTADR
jgi:hypothetical protein